MLTLSLNIDIKTFLRNIISTFKDQYCANKGVFIIENLCNLDKVLNEKKLVKFTVNTYPINFADMTGLPCRVTAEVE